MKGLKMLGEVREFDLKWHQIFSQNALQLKGKEYYLRKIIHEQRYQNFKLITC